MNYITMNNNNIKLLIPLRKDDRLDKGTIVRRVSRDKDQQGCFAYYDDKGGMILVNVIDMKEKIFIAEAGVLNIKRGEQIYRYSTRFGDSPLSSEALDLIQNWVLYRKNTEFQDAIKNFVITSFTPEQIIEFRENDMLDHVFVPIQQKFKIGRYKEKVNISKLWRDKFRELLDTLKIGDHLTYLALIPKVKGHDPRFYSIGSKPHEETDFCLRCEPFNFRATHGGHIKALRTDNKKKHFLIDAGSNYKGRGVLTPVSTAIDVVEVISMIYRDYDFTPVEGRGAFGTDQSY
jgi:hypothetical protein